MTSQITFVNSKSSIGALAQVPFLLLLLCSATSEQEVPDDTTRTGLYDRALETLLGGANRARQWRKLLEEVAWTMFSKSARATHINAEELDQILCTSPNRPLPVTSDEPSRLSIQEKSELLIRELERKGLLIPYDSGRVFALPHRSLVEYLMGCALARHSCDERTWTIFEKKSWDPDWENTIAFACGKMSQLDVEDCGRLLESLTKAEEQDYQCHRSGLAVLCGAEISQQKRFQVEKWLSLAATLLLEQHLCKYGGDGSNSNDTNRYYAALASCNPAFRESTVLEWVADLVLTSEWKTARNILTRMGPSAVGPSVLIAIENLLNTSVSRGENLLGELARVGVNASNSTLLPFLMHLSRQDRSQIRACAIKRLKEFASRGDVSRIIRQALDDPDDLVRMTAERVALDFPDQLLPDSILERLWEEVLKGKGFDLWLLTPTFHRSLTRKIVDHLWHSDGGGRRALAISILHGAMLHVQQRPDRLSASATGFLIDAYKSHILDCLTQKDNPIVIPILELLLDADWLEWDSLLEMVLELFASNEPAIIDAALRFVMNVGKPLMTPAILRRAAEVVEEAEPFTCDDCRSVRVIAQRIIWKASILCDSIHMERVAQVVMSDPNLDQIILEKTGPRAPLLWPGQYVAVVRAIGTLQPTPDSSVLAIGSVLTSGWARAAKPSDEEALQLMLDPNRTVQMLGVMAADIDSADSGTRDRLTSRAIELLDDSSRCTRLLAACKLATANSESQRNLCRSVLLEYLADNNSLINDFARRHFDLVASAGEGGCDPGAIRRVSSLYRRLDFLRTRPALGSTLAADRIPKAVVEILWDSAHNPNDYMHAASIQYLRQLDRYGLRFFGTEHMTITSVATLSNCNLPHLHLLL